MAPKKKKEACCSLFNPLGGLFKDSDDEQLESLSDNEIERIEATPEKINTGKPVKIECRVRLRLARRSLRHMTCLTSTCRPTKR